MNPIFNSPYKNQIILGLVIFLITAIFSSGHYHPDEHFQILEFCNYKLGKSPAADLPWEYHQQIRPALQPAIAWMIIKIAGFVGVNSPFNWAIILRLFSALLSWLVISKMSLLLIKDIKTEKGKKIFLLLCLFLWFIPFISVRFSSENYGAITFFGAVYLIISSDNETHKRRIFKYAFAGLLLGFSFFFRFQMAFAILGLGLWLLIIKKESLKNFLIIVLCGLLSTNFCVYIDYWFYGEFVLTPFNYFKANIIQDVASNWGRDAWWYYFESFIPLAIPPFSIFLLLFFCIGIYKKPKSVIAWCLIPFILGHMAVGHKEMRFMIPIVFGFIYLVSVGIDYFITKDKYQKLGRILLIIFIGINLPLLAFKMFTPAHEAVNYYKYLYDSSLDKNQDLICIEKSIYKLVGLKVNFYKSSNVNPIVIKDEAEVVNYLKIVKPDSTLLFKTQFKSKDKYESYTSKLSYCFYPEWLLGYNFNDWESRTKIWNIQKLQRIQK